MDLGSLYEILRDDTKPLGEDVLSPILRDVSRGMRFLHASDPPFIHGDLKVGIARHARALHLEFLFLVAHYSIPWGYVRL